MTVPLKDCLELTDNTPLDDSHMSLFSFRWPEPQARQGARCRGGGRVPNQGQLPRGGRGQVQSPAARDRQQPRQEEPSEGEQGNKAKRVQIHFISS